MPGNFQSACQSGPCDEALHEAALSFSARGDLAACGFALNEILRHYESRLDAAYDFQTLVVQVGSGQTLMRPPVVTEAQMAFALGDGGQVARETGRVYEITRQASLTTSSQAGLIRRPVRNTGAGPRNVMTAGGVVLERHGRKVAARPASGQQARPCTNTPQHRSSNPCTTLTRVAGKVSSCRAERSRAPFGGKNTEENVMSMLRRTVLGSAASMALLGARRGRAQTPTLRVGVLTDLSGTYSDIAGPTSVACVRQAIEDFGISGKGMQVEVVSGDHQNKADIGANIARQWFDRDSVDMITDVPNSSVALAVAQVAKEKNKAYVNSSMGVEFTASAQCNANTIQWTYDVYMVSKLTGSAVVRAGGDSWFFITADYAFGQQLEQTATKFIQQNGGKVLGRVAYPFPGTTDFSSFLIQAKSSGARVLGLANAGGDTINTIKQAYEFGLPKGGMRLAAMLMFISDVHALGLEVAQGLTLSNSYYWDLNDRTRAFNQRIRSKTPNNWPGMLHAGCYAGTLHYLKAVADMGIAAAKADGAGAIARMKAMPTDDDCFGKGSIRPDGRKLHPGYLFEVKKPSESKGPWDYYRLVATTPADEAFRPMSEGSCPLARG